MAIKKLKICIKLVLDNDGGDFNNVTPFNPANAANFLGAIRSCLNEIYGYNKGANPLEAFEKTSVNSFQSVDVDVEG
jgi:hypothetical protein